VTENKYILLYNAQFVHAQMLSIFFTFHPMRLFW